ncbi:MAG TPA: elongation factor P [Anaerolineae bacterium]|nr:elongation factor P [Anaerolineae bacterium]HQI85126.1 elongation factor P [Anaerolineae bacterium]
MIDANELRKGTTFILDGELYQVLEYQHYKPGRGNAIIRTKIRNLRTGASIPRNFLSGDRFEEAPVERRAAQYLYEDGEAFYFMDAHTYDQVHVTADMIGDKAGFLKEGMEVTLTVLENEVLDADLPTSVELEVVESEMAVAGDTATGASKIVVCDTGLKVQVPLFVNVGDTIRVDTRSGEYLTRV